MKLHNKYYILRHGEAQSNVKNVISSWPETFENSLTQRGREMIQESAKTLIDKHIDLIFASDLLRAKQTAEIVGKALAITPEFDRRLREIDFGILNGGPIMALDKAFEKEEERITKTMPNGENYEEVLKRLADFLQDIDGQYENKNILIVSHEGPLWILQNNVNGFSLLEGLQHISRDQRIHKGQIKELN